MTATFFPLRSGWRGGDVALAKSSLGNGGFVLADSDRFVAREFQYARLLAKGRADASRKFRKIIRTVQYLIGFVPFAPVERVLEFRVFIAQRTCPVAEGCAAVHTARGLELAVVAVQCLFHLAEVCDTFVYRTVTRLLAGDIEECFWISHDEQIKKLKN